MHSLIMEGHCVGQAGLALSEAMLAVSNHPLSSMCVKDKVYKST